MKYSLLFILSALFEYLAASIMTVDLISTKYITIVLNHHLFYSSLTQMWLPFIIADTGQDLEGHRKQKLRKLYACLSVNYFF